MLGASTEQNCTWELCCFTVAFINRITEWLGMEGTLEIVQFQPAAMAGTPTTRPGCSEPHPTWP